MAHAGSAPHRYFRGLRAPLHISHRGGAALAPENTLEAFGAAVSIHRTDVLELDVQCSKDGALVVFHDETLERCTDGTGPVSQHSLAQLRALDAGFHFTPDGGRTHPFRGQGVRIPTLDELLEALPRVRLNIDVKCALPSGVAAFARALLAAGAVERTCLGSMEDALAAQLHEALPQACLFFPRQAATAFVLAVRTGEEPPVDPRYSVLELPCSYGGEPLVDAALVEAARRAGKWLNVWTVDDAPTMRALRDIGVGGIMTDRPDVLRQVLDAT